MTTGQHPKVRGTGDLTYTEPDPTQLDKAIDSLGENEHLWMIIATFQLSPMEAARTHEGLTQTLDVDHLLNVTPVGCLVCEQSYEHAATQPCPGEPSRYLPDGTPIWGT